MAEVKSKKDSCKCQICKNSNYFDLPTELIEELQKGEVVIFAGAGISTESEFTGQTIYEQVKTELNIKSNKEFTFPELMSRYCKQINGRIKLLKLIKKKFDYLEAFPELFKYATRFHREISTMHFIENIVTTNWDDYFERETNATPFVVDEDFAFWNLPGRKVLKIHGSISNLGTIVATEEDYKKCYKRLRDGALGNTLKHFIGTKTILFVGYSLRDTDFIKVYQFLKKTMKQSLPQSYIVTIDSDNDARYRKLGLAPIYTNAWFFVELIKLHCIALKYMLDDEIFGDIENILSKVQENHFKVADNFNLNNCPDVIYCLSYQDGLIHSFERTLSKLKTGWYSNPDNINSTISFYEKLRTERRKHRRYFDVAYIDGYVNGLYFIMMDDKARKALPHFFILGMDGYPSSFSEFKKLRKRAKEFHQQGYKRAIKIVSKDIAGTDTIIHHTPYL